MRVFVAGATGGLGRRVVRELVARGHQVVGLARSAENAALLRKLGAAPAAADLFDAESLARAGEGAEVIMHLASAVPTRIRQSLGDWRLHERIMTEGTANLLHAAVRVRARFYVQQSVIGVHGSAGESWVDEDWPLVPVRVADAAATAERLVREAEAMHRLPAAILRGGEVYDPPSDRTGRMLTELKAGKRSIIGMGANFRSMIHADDLARAWVLAVEKRPAGETFLVVDDEPVRWRDLYTHLARQTGGPPPRYLPPGIGRLTAGGLAAEWLTASLRCRNGKLKRHFGWQPRFPSFREGFAAAATDDAMMR